MQHKLGNWYANRGKHILLVISQVVAYISLILGAIGLIVAAILFFCEPMLAEYGFIFLAALPIYALVWYLFIEIIEGEKIILKRINFCYASNRKLM